jgi:hypothetical protein
MFMQPSFSLKRLLYRWFNKENTREEIILALAATLVVPAGTVVALIAFR